MNNKPIINSKIEFIIASIALSMISISSNQYENYSPVTKRYKYGMDL